ncbi:hypothetical protein FOH38_18485 [Lysinibacillus fusiformis]|nr:hypothetical protein FOH38_18485 [Lysinibacillus fusiformis]
MKKFSFKVKKEIRGIEADFCINQDVISTFNEISGDNQIKCTSLLFKSEEGKTSIIIEFECSYKEDEFLLSSINKAYFFSERNLFETVLMAAGKKYRRTVYIVDLHKEAEVINISNLSDVSELEFKKIQHIVNGAFRKGLSLVPVPLNLGNIDIEEMLNASIMLTNIENSEKKGLIQYALFYINIMESQFDQSGLGRFDYIQRFRLVWSAFNSIYQMYPTGNGDKRDVENYSKKPHVVEFFKNNFNELLEDLTVLSKAELKDKKNNNISNLLKNSLLTKDYEGISLNTLLCIYVIRNTALHGNIEQNDELSLSRKAFSIITPIVTSSILEEIKIL